MRYVKKLFDVSYQDFWENKVQKIQRYDSREDDKASYSSDESSSSSSDPSHDSGGPVSLIRIGVDSATSRVISYGSI